MKKMLFVCFLTVVLMLNASCFTIGNTRQNNLQTNSNSRPSNQETEKNIKYDGVYLLFVGGGYATSYFRFYENGIVISVISTGRPEQIKAWFNYENEDLGKGTYIIDGIDISFTIYSDDVIIEYCGAITENGMILDEKSSNGYEESGLKYIFYRW
jgi:hypothetical protein